MGVFDQAARYATRADPDAPIGRVLAESGLTLSFRELLDTRALPKPGGRDRTADLVAALDDPSAPDAPWLLLLEFQAQHDPEKLDVSLEELANLRVTARWGPDRGRKYKVIAGFVYLTGACPERTLDMRTPNGQGLRNDVLVWDVAREDAQATVEAVASGALSWGMLFWVPLMAGGGDDTVITRWAEVASQAVTDEQRRVMLVSVALIFAELAGRVPQWRRAMSGIQLTESQVVNEWLLAGFARGTLEERRRNLLKTIDARFPGQLPAEYRRMIEQQESLDLLDDWWRQAQQAQSFDQVIEALRR